MVIIEKNRAKNEGSPGNFKKSYPGLMFGKIKTPYVRLNHPIRDSHKGIGEASRSPFYRVVTGACTFSPVKGCSLYKQ